jgi:tetratricopeptide (TPR) repeat protein
VYFEFMRWLLSLVWLLCAARAESLEDAQALYARGAFLEASRVAASLNSSAGFAFAARALSEHASEQPRAEREGLYMQCERFARRALALNSRNADGHFEWGASVGNLGNLRGAAYAFVNGVATQVRDHFERALELNPRHTLALVALGRWHAEIVGRGVGFLFGGDAAKVGALFERALLSDPRSIFVRLEYARTLLTLDANANRTRAKTLLEAALEFEPRDYLERKYSSRAQFELTKLR